MKNILMGFFLIFGIQTQIFAELNEEVHESLDVMGNIEVPMPEKTNEQELAEAELHENTDFGEARGMRENTREEATDSEPENTDTENTDSEDSENPDQALRVPGDLDSNSEAASDEDLEAQRAEEAELIETGAGEEEQVE